MIIDHPKSQEELERQARIIATFVCETKAEQRRDLFMAVAAELSKEHKYHTANMFKDIAACW